MWSPASLFYRFFRQPLSIGLRLVTVKFDSMKWCARPTFFMKINEQYYSVVVKSKKPTKGGLFMHCDNSLTTKAICQVPLSFRHPCYLRGVCSELCHCAVWSHRRSAKYKLFAAYYCVWRIIVKSQSTQISMLFCEILALPDVSYCANHEWRRHLEFHHAWLNHFLLPHAICIVALAG